MQCWCIIPTIVAYVNPYRTLATVRPRESLCLEPSGLMLTIQPSHLLQGEEVSGLVACPLSATIQLTMDRGQPTGGICPMSKRERLCCQLRHGRSWFGGRALA